MTDKAYADSCRADYTKAGVVNTVFDDVIADMEKVSLVKDDPWEPYMWEPGMWGYSIFDEVLEQLENG